MRPAALALIALVAGAVAPASAADFVVNEITKTYPISGDTGSELYASIGARGPVVGNGVRTIAHTMFDLKWSRKYEPQGNACRLVSAKPFFTITTTLPKPSGTLAPHVRRRWDAFIAGIVAHEKVHGQQMREMVERILATTVGLTVENDRGCKRIREEIKTPLKAASDEQRQRSRDFDRIEMSAGGNVHRLILALVNGS